MASSSHIKPGDSGAIKVTIDTRSRIVGTLFKIIEVFSNDPKKPKVILTLKVAI